ncbi:hypothetical protein Tco_0265448 [Tanacetum coccineum]
MAYPLPLDTAYRSSEIEILVFLFDFHAKKFSTFKTNPTDCLSRVSEYSEEEEAEAMAETMEQYMSKTRTDYGSGFLNKYCPPGRTAKKIEEINNFQQEPDETLYQILDSRGTVPTKTATNAKMVIQDMTEYLQKWHNGTSRGRSTETSNGMAAIQAQLNNLGREIKKVKEKFYAAQVGREQCKGSHYTKDCPLKEEGKTLEEAYYTQFDRP